MRRPRVGGRTAPSILLAATLLLAGCGRAAAPRPGPPVLGLLPGPVIVGAFPAPGTPTASPKTQISLRGITAANAGTITVTGSTTGVHAGTLECWSDGEGCSYLPSRPFSAAGERVSVATDLPIAGAIAGDYSFTVVGSRPRGASAVDVSKRALALQHAINSQVARVSDADPSYRSAPGLRPPRLTVLGQPAAQSSPGYLFTVPALVPGVVLPDVQSGPLISEEDGEPVWFKPESSPGNPLDGYDGDFSVQHYAGHPVLTYLHGNGIHGGGQDDEFRMLDEHYQTIATVTAGNGYGFDLHEARLTPQGTLLALVYNPVTTDLSSVGGSPDARAIDTIVQEIDIKTGLVEFEFHSMGNIALTEGPPQEPGHDVRDDYVHGNSVSEMLNGNLLLSGRVSSALYQLDRTTGQILARYGGKRSDYAFATPSARFSFQHDALQQPDGTITLFDNQGAPFAPGSQSRGLVLSVDEATKTIALVHAFPHAGPALQAGSLGSVQRLPNGNYLVGYGAQAFLTEFTPAGGVVLDGYLAGGHSSYRAYRFPWVGRPLTRPSAVVDHGSVYVSWNGATEVAAWRVQAGPTLATVLTQARRGFETALVLPAGVTGAYRVSALDARGGVLGSSKPAKIPSSNTPSTGTSGVPSG